MRKYVVILLSLISMVLIVTAVFASIRRSTPGMQVRLNKRDLPEHGVRIITSLDPSFDTKVLKHFKNKTPEMLKPFSVFIENLGTRTIVAYSLTWKFAKQDGQITGNTVGYSEPSVLMGDEIPKGRGFKHTTAIPPNTVRCFTWNSQIMEDDSSLQASQQSPGDDVLREVLSSELAKATDLTVTLDGAVFDDGTFVGTNLVFFQQLQAIVSAKVDLLREIAEASEQGRIEQALASITAKSLEPEVRISEEFSADEYYRSYRKLFATEIAGMTMAYGKDKMVPHLVKAYRRSRPILRMQ